MRLRQIPRDVLYKMSTDQLVELHGQLTRIEEKVKAELICRGEY